MPRKKSTVAKNSSIEKTAVKAAFMDCKAACEDTVARTVADLAVSNVITREQAERITAVMSIAVSDSIFQVMATKGL